MLATSVLVSGDARLNVLGEHLVQEKDGRNQNGLECGGGQEVAGGAGVGESVTGVQKEAETGAENIAVPTRYILKWCTCGPDNSAAPSSSSSSESTKESNELAKDDGPAAPSQTLKVESPLEPLYPPAFITSGLPPILTYDTRTHSFTPSSMNDSTQINPYFIATPPGQQPLQFLDVTASSTSRANNVLYGIFEFEFSEDGTQIVGHTVQNVELLNDANENKIFDDSALPSL